MNSRSFSSSTPSAATVTGCVRADSARRRKSPPPGPGRPVRWRDLERWPHWRILGARAADGKRGPMRPLTRPSGFPAPRKSVTLPRHPFPAQPHPTPRTPHLFPATVPFLPTNPLQSLKFANPIETHAHPCYPRPREGPTPRPGNAATNRDQAPGIRWNVENWPPAADPAPLSYSATRCHFCVTEKRTGHYRIEQNRRRSQLRAAQNVAETNRFRFPAKPVPVEACPELVEWACPELAEWAGSGNNELGGAK